MPIRAASGIDEASFSVSRRSCISIPARTARSASSSWALGKPKTATTASPMNFSHSTPMAFDGRTHLGEVAVEDWPEHLGVMLLA